MAKIPLDVADDVPGVRRAEDEAALMRLLQVAVVAFDGQENKTTDDDLAAQDRYAIRSVPLLPGFLRRNQPLTLGLSFAYSTRSANRSSCTPPTVLLSFSRASIWDMTVKHASGNSRLISSRALRSL